MTGMVKKIGGSLAVVIPTTLVRKLRLVEGMSFDLIYAEDVIVLRESRQHRRRPLAEIVAQISPASYRRRSNAFGGGRSVGNEVW